MRFSSRTLGLGGGGGKLLLLTLTALVASLLLATLGVGAQTDDGSDDASTPQGRIIARVQDRTDDGGVDNYRIEFGFFPQWALDDKDPWSEAIDRWSEWLPRSRFLTKTVLDQRDADDNRRWLRSSLISIPAGPNTPQDGGADDGFAGEDTADNLIEGRVVARYSPDSRGRLRVEFGFLPECAFTSTANTQEAVAQYGEQFLPRARYLTASLIENRRGDWLRSSPVEIPANRCGTTDPIITITPPTTREFIRGEVVEDTRIGEVRGTLPTELDPISVTGVPQGLTVRLDAQQRLILSGTVDADAELGAHLVRITVGPATGDPISETITIRITERPTGEPVVTWRGYRTNEMAVLGDDSPRIVAPSATVNGDFVDLDYTYKVDEAAEDVCDVNRNDGVITPLRAGTCVIIATSVETDEYAADESDPVEVRITRVNPNLRWDGYDGEELRAGGDPARPREPQPRVPEARAQDELDYTYSATPSSICAVNPKTGELTPHREGDCDITVRSAETDKFLADEVTITVPIVGNLPPECDRIPTVGPLDGGETSKINLDVYCRDPEGEDLSYSNAQSDDRAVVTVRLIGSDLTVTAAQTPAGDRAQVTFTAADPARNEIEAQFTVRVEEIQPPEVRSITCRSSSPDVGDRVTCTADIRGGEPDEWDWRGGDPSGPSDAETYRTEFRQAGDQPVDLTVRNAAGSDSGSTTVRVQQPPPQIIRISCSPSSADKREQVSCEAFLRGGDPSPDGWDWRGGDSDGDREVYNTSFGTSGRKTVSLTVSNSAGRDSYSDDHAVTVINRRPERDGRIADVTVDVDGSESVNISDNFRDPDGDRLTYEVDSDNSAVGASATGATVTVTGSREGSATITVTADDGDGGTATQTFRVTVAVNQAPECLSISGLSPIVLGGRGSARFRCSDPDGPPESIRVTVASDDSSIVEASLATGDGVVQIIGTLRSTRLNFSGLDEGSTTIRATATDAKGASTTIAFSVTVTAPPDDDPEINSISCTPSTVATSTNVNCTANVSGTEPLTYSWSGGDSSGSSTSYSPIWSSAGAKTVSLTVRNSAGSDSDSTAVTVMEPPSISSLGCPSSATVNQAVTCSPSVTGTEPLTYSWSGGDSDSGQSGSTYSPSWSTTGNKTVSLTVRNAVGSDSNSVNVGDGVQPPVPVISCTPSTVATNTSVSCEVSGNSGGAISTYAWSGGPSNGSGSSYSPSWSSAGSKTVSLTASNARGSGSDSTSVTVVAAPVINSISCTPSTVATNTSVNCTASLSGDAPDSYSWRGGDSSGSSSSYSPSWSSAGNKTVSLTVSNGGGSDSSSTSLTVIEAPEISSISCSPSSPSVDQSVTCTANLRGGTPDSYLWSGGSSSGRSSSYSTSFSSSGTKTVRLTVRNSAGSDNDSTSVIVPVEKPDITIRCSYSSIREGGSTRCEVSRNRGGAITTYTWSASGGSPSSGSSSTYEPRFNTAGTYTVSLTASNAGGNDSDSSRIIVSEIPPEGTFWCPLTTEVGRGVRCDWTQTGGSPATSIAWSGGDSSGSGATYRPSFSSFGWNTVRLEVSNSGGTSSASRRIRVVPTPPSSQYARCGSDAIRVYWFDRTNFQKRHLDITGDEATRIFGRAWWNTIGHMGQSACDIWPTGSRLTGRPPS